MVEKRVLHVYEGEKRFYVGPSSKIEKGEYMLKKGIMVQKKDLPEGKYSEEKIKEFYLKAEKNNTTRNVCFSLEELMNNSHTIIL